MCMILEKVVDKNKKNWPNKLPEALWAYRITIRTLTQATLYSSLRRGSTLATGNTTSLLRATVHRELANEEKASLCLADLQNPDSKRNQRRSNALNKASDFDHPKRWTSPGDMCPYNHWPKEREIRTKWEGPFIIDKVFSNKAYLLTTTDGNRIISPTNALFLKIYYPWRTCIYKRYATSV